MSARRTTRASVPLLPRIRTSTGFEFVEGQCIDISIGGMFMSTSAPLESDTLLKFECQVAGETLSLKGLARVVWHRTSNGERDRPAGMGLKFVKLEPGSAELIGELVRAAQAMGRTAPMQSLPSQYSRTDSVPPPEARISNPARLSVVTAVPVSSEDEAAGIDLAAQRAAAAQLEAEPEPRPESMRVPLGTTPRDETPPELDLFGRAALVPEDQRPREGALWVRGKLSSSLWLVLGAALLALAVTWAWLT